MEIRKFVEQNKTKIIVTTALGLAALAAIYDANFKPIATGKAIRYPHDGRTSVSAQVDPNLAVQLANQTGGIYDHAELVTAIPEMTPQQ